MTTAVEGDARQPMRKIGAASLAGATLEWYDFQIYGWLAALAFPQLFFPNSDPLVGTLIAFVTFGVGFVMRPIGAVVFGHLGDKVGRKSMLVVTLMIVGIPTVLTGLLPTYETAGIWAPILLVAFRLIQGFGLGGEFGGAALLVVEHAPKGKRGIWGTWAGLGNPGGQLLSIAVVFVVVALLPDDQFLSWGWRVPYLLSIVILIAGLYVRLKIAETPAFRQMKEAGAESRLPVVTLLRTHPTTILKAFGARVADAGTWGVFSVFGISYVTVQLGLPRTVAIVGVTVGLVGQIIMIPVAGALSDRFGRRPPIMAGAVIVAALVFPSFLLMDTGQPVLVWLAFLLGLPIGTSLIFGPVGAYLPELFESNVRYSGTSVVFQLSALAAGFVPAVAASLLVAGGGRPWLVAALVVALAVITFSCVLRLPETFRRDLAAAPTETTPAGHP